MEIEGSQPTPFLPPTPPSLNSRVTMTFNFAHYTPLCHLYTHYAHTPRGRERKWSKVSPSKQLHWHIQKQVVILVFCVVCLLGSAISVRFRWVPALKRVKKI